MYKKNFLILNATSLYQGGGYTFLKKFKKYNFDKIYYDTRLKKIKINPFLYKLYLDFIFFFQKNKNTKIIYLSGTPPIVKNKAYTIGCFQNANIFNNNIISFNWLFSKDFLRYVFFYLFKKNFDKWIVFSQISKSLLVNHGVSAKNIKMFNIINLKQKTKKYKKKYNFIYPGVLLKHKNHLNLILALILLSKENLYPRVLLTINKKLESNSNLFKLILDFKLKVTCKYFNNSIDKAYRMSEALIYPSLSETIGLPIIEAHNNGLFILASNRVYAKQFIKPNILFDPLSPRDIADKIKKFLTTKNSLKKVLEQNKYKFLYFKGKNIYSQL
jgi:glycosyltransferase involved in cell wall biosynthesis